MDRFKLCVPSILLESTASRAVSGESRMSELGMPRGHPPTAQWRHWLPDQREQRAQIKRGRRDATFVIGNWQLCLRLAIFSKRTIRLSILMIAYRHLNRLMIAK